MLNFTGLEGLKIHGKWLPVSRVWGLNPKPYFFPGPGVLALKLTWKAIWVPTKTTSVLKGLGFKGFRFYGLGFRV